MTGSAPGAASEVPQPDATTVSLRSVVRRRRLRASPYVVLVVVLACAGVVAATAYLSGALSVLTGTTTSVPGGDCGFVSLPSTNVVGNGSQSGANYISFSPSLSQATVTQTVTATLNQYGTGASGVEYLIDEVGFGCNSVDAGAVIPFTLGATHSTTSAKWVAMEVSFDKNNPYVNPTFGVPCDRSGGGLYLPTGATPSKWGTSNYTGGDTYTFSANQSGAVHLTDDACTANADPSQTTLPSLHVATTSSSLVIFYYISFVVTGSTAAITNPAFTLGFT